VTQTADHAIPTTPAQKARHARILAAAVEILSAEGGEALQMKDLAQRARVSLATLYRYFPSRDYVLLAVSVARYQEAAHKVMAEVPQGESVRERVTDHLLREFGAVRREQRLTASLVQALTETRRGYSPMIETIEHLHRQIVAHVAAGGGSLTDQQNKVLPVVIDIFSAATRLWLAGIFSVADAEFQIKTGCELLEVPDEVVSAELERAAPDGRIRLTGRVT
jgi:TetR/AcrR family transcriptional regulator, cholesterol catabolism regulator